MGEIILGMPGPWAEDNRETSDHYTTKIGGVPDWPIPEMGIKSELLQCGNCGNHLCLVAQVYAPVSSEALRIEERVIYVLGCIQPECGNNAESWRVLRVQKSQSGEESNTTCQEEMTSTSSFTISNNNRLENLWIDSLGEDEDGSDDDLDLEELSRAFAEAAKLASDSKKENGKQQPKKTGPITSRSKVSTDKMPVVPCFYICPQQEPSAQGVTSSSTNYSTVSLKGSQNDLDEHGQEEKWEEEGYEYDRALNADRTFLKFKKRMDANPEQCFRYWYGGKPLLSTGDLGEPGQCKLCGEPRHFEVQLMPPLLYFLQEVADDCLKQTLETWNWMTLMVYTCSKSCSHAFQQRDFDCHGWIVAEEAVLSQYEKSVSGASQLSYLS